MNQRTGVNDDATTEPTGYLIPAPTDPAERARGEAGVARRRAAGSIYVGDNPKPTTPAIDPFTDFKCDGCGGAFSALNLPVSRLGHNGARHLLACSACTAATIPTADATADADTWPYWQTEPCPAWCGEQHAAQDADQERRHFGGGSGISLTLAKPEKWANGPGPRDFEWRPPVMFVEFAQGWRESEPELQLTRGEEDQDPLRLTVAEAHQLHDQLTELFALDSKTR